MGPGDLVVDVGAGAGALTAALVAAGPRVLAVEAHPGRAAWLRTRFRGADVTVVERDLRALRWPRRPFVVVANPPWSLLEELRAGLEAEPHLRAAHLVVPRWLARRWATRYAHVALGGSVRAEAFTPPAPTGAAVVVLHRATARR